MRFNKGDILVLRDAQFSDGALVVDGYDESGRLLTHPFGGDFQHVCPAGTERRFRIVDESERGRALFRQAKFCLANSEDLFTGWTDGQAWNGWAQPHFDFAEGKRLIAWLKNDKARFDGEHDAFVTLSEDGDEEVWLDRSITISDGSCINAYSIGAGCWCWDEVEG